MGVMTLDCRVYLTSINLHKELFSMKRQAKLVSIINQVFHYNGLLLCINTNYPTTLVVWNPYWCQTRRIDAPPKPVKNCQYSYALGYDDQEDYKILRYITQYNISECKIYHLNSSSWMVLDVTTRDWSTIWFNRGVSLKGNTYFYAKNVFSATRQQENGFLICFDFTTDRFGPYLPFPFRWFSKDTVILSSIVRGEEEQLVVLFQRWDTSEMEIWVTTKIEPNHVSWSTKAFLTLDMRPLTFDGFQFSVTDSTFFIDEENEVVVVFDRNKDSITKPTHNVAHIIGVDGFFKEVDLGESSYTPLLCYYAPSLVQLN